MKNILLHKEIHLPLTNFKVFSLLSNYPIYCFLFWHIELAELKAWSKSSFGEGFLKYFIIFQNKMVTGITIMSHCFTDHQNRLKHFCIYLFFFLCFYLSHKKGYYETSFFWKHIFSEIISYSPPKLSMISKPYC